MNITAVSVQTPKKLLAEFKKGNRPEYNHKNDVLMDELDVLVSKYRQSLSVEDKKKLIEQERRILLDGLKNPEMTLARNYENVSKFITPDSKILVDDALRLFDATGFFRLARLSGNFKITPKNEDFEILKQAYFNTDGNTKFGNRAKDIILTTLDSIQQRTPNFKDDITRMLLEIKEKTKNKNLQEYIETVLEGKSVDNLLQDLNLNPDNEKKLQALLLNSKPNSNEKITDLTTRILKRRGVSYETYEFAILGAGKFRSDANFEILKNIALKKADKDARFKECALQSLALYIKDKPDEVKDVLTQVKKENSIYSPLATILYDKVTGNYHNQHNRELKYAKLNKKQIDKYNKNKLKILQLEESLNKKQQNACDRFLLPFKKVLSRLDSDGYKYIIQSDTFTKQHPELSGKRYFETGAGILNSGDFYDVFDGINAENYSMMNKYRISPANHANQTGHELGHAINRLFIDSDSKTLNRLYQKALKMGIVLDYYAAANMHEYFAQGVEAFISIYKPHREILNNSPLAHTRYELLVKDPDLYKFVRKCLKRYC